MTSVLADFAALHPASWAYWQVIDVSGGWALLVGNADTGALGPVNTKWFAIAQFSRHIRSGFDILATADGGLAASVAAHDAATNTLIVVVSNIVPKTTDFVVNLGAFSGIPAAPVAAWITSTASSTPEPSASHSPLKGLTVDSQGRVAVTLPAYSLVTLEIKGVKR